MRSSKPAPDTGRHVGFAVAAAAAMPIVAGCGAASADTNSEEPRWDYAVSAGANGAANSMEAHGAVVIGPEVSEELPAGSDVGFYAMLANTDVPDDRDLEGLTQAERDAELEDYADELTSVSVDVGDYVRGEHEAAPTPAEVDLDGPVEVVPEQPVQIDQDEPLAILQDMDEALRGGEYLQVTLSFAQAGDIVMDVPVMPRNELETSGWADYPEPNELEADEDDTNEDNQT